MADGQSHKMILKEPTGKVLLVAWKHQLPKNLTASCGCKLTKTNCACEDNRILHALGVYYMPSTFESTFHILTPLVLVVSQFISYYNFPHFHRGWSWSSQKLSKVPNITQLIHPRAPIQMQRHLILVSKFLNTTPCSTAPPPPSVMTLHGKALNKHLSFLL